MREKLHYIRQWWNQVGQTIWGRRSCRNKQNRTTTSHVNSHSRENQVKNCDIRQQCSITDVKKFVKQRQRMGRTCFQSRWYETNKNSKRLQAHRQNKYLKNKKEISSKLDIFGAKYSVTKFRSEEENRILT